MSNNRHNHTGSARKVRNSDEPLEIKIMSFGYKEGEPPLANLLFDVRFLKNPFWVEELRPLTGRDRAVQDYVLQQPSAADFLNSVHQMIETLLPQLLEQNIADLTIAFGCTGGQHRSATMVEALASELAKKYPEHRVIKNHRELEKKTKTETDTKMPAAIVQNVKAEE